MAERTLEEMLKSLLSRLSRLERRIAVRGGSPSPVRGTTAERDGLFGIPATAAARAALANQRVTWFNTEKGWSESYYAVTGTAGLTAPALLAGHATGWYPLAGADIFAHRGKSGAFQAAGTTAREDVLAVSQIRRGGGTDSGVGGMAVPTGGYYRLVHNTYYSGGGALAWVASSVAINGTRIKDQQMYFSGSDNQVGSTVVYPLKTGDIVSLWAVAAGNTNTYGSDGFNGAYVEYEYLGPPLVKA